MENKICIYCRKTDREKFKGREHVIPRSFGTFGSKTPTLHNVCDECNSSFKHELDQALARDTLEGVTRYKRGIFSSEREFPKTLRFALDETEEAGEYGGAILGGYDPATGKPLPIVAQFWIHNIQTKEWEKYTLDEIKNIEITDEKYGPGTPGSRQMRVMGPSQEEYEAVKAELKKHNIPYREKEMMGPPPFLKDVNDEGKIEIKGTITGTIDKPKKRALVKTLFNFAAYYIGADEVLKPEWDRVRQFVHNDGETLSGRMTQEPFWTGQETDQMRFANDSYNLRIENKDGNVIGVIQFFNLFTFEFVLVENYSLAPEKEMAYRFTPGEEPYFGKKMTMEEWRNIGS
jgi:hypothetical protein